MDDVSSGYNPLAGSSELEVCRPHLWRMLRETLLYTISHPSDAKLVTLTEHIFSSSEKWEVKSSGTIKLLSLRKNWMEERFSSLIPIS